MGALFPPLLNTLTVHLHFEATKFLGAVSLRKATCILAVYFSGIKLQEGDLIFPTCSFSRISDTESATTIPHFSSPETLPGTFSRCPDHMGLLLYHHLIPSYNQFGSGGGEEGTDRSFTSSPVVCIPYLLSPSRPLTHRRPCRTPPPPGSPHGAGTLSIPPLLKRTEGTGNGGGGGGVATSQTVGPVVAALAWFPPSSAPGFRFPRPLHGA